MVRVAERIKIENGINNYNQFCAFLDEIKKDDLINDFFASGLSSDFFWENDYEIETFFEMQGIGFAHGSFKLVFWDISGIDKNIVIKIPMDYTNEKENDCDKETDFYYRVPKDFKKYFAETKYFGMYDDIPIYVADRCESDFDKWQDLSTLNYINESFDVDKAKKVYAFYSKFGYSNDLKEFDEDNTCRTYRVFKEIYNFKKNEIERLFDWVINSGLIDLHGENIGFANGECYIIDYAMY